MRLVFVNNQSDDDFELKSKYHCLKLCLLNYNSNFEFLESSRNLLFNYAVLLFLMCTFMTIKQGNVY